MSSSPSYLQLSTTNYQEDKDEERVHSTKKAKTEREEEKEEGK
jgi:hypothetical protein